ncbi:MAG: hypothetical protein K2N63_01320 [Lachnospiraceae bacterium]|nr:hypothetical protein [Lachnospiraceae bacterium]
MRKETICINERNLMFVVAGQLYDQAPNRQPRKVEEIMSKVRFNFRNDARCDKNNEWYSISVDKDNVYGFVKSMLVSIPEFQELNLTQNEYDAGIKVDDEKRAKFKVTTSRDKNDEDSWRNDFVDIDAFIQNVNRRLLDIIDIESDCFLCIHQDQNSKSTLDCGSSDKCKICCANPNLTNNFECRRHPKGEYTFACKFDCPKSRYICCEECGDRNTCGSVCDSHSEDCGLAINRKGLNWEESKA